MTYGYNDGDQLTGIYENGSTALATYAYDIYGHATTLSRGSGYATSAGFDANIRLSTLTHTVSGGSNAITLGYDGRGNLTSDGSGASYGYNVNNLLTSATQAGVTSTLAYDAENRLYSVTKSGVTTKFLYDGTDLIAEYNSANALLRRYVHGLGSDNPLVWYEGATTTPKYYLYSDERGSITAVTSSTGGVNTVYGYTEYGVPSTLSGALSSRFRYTGQTWLSEVGLYYYKARMYAPSLGRFLQTDPIGYGDGMNMYAYVHNDPINGTDPSGLAGDEPPIQEVTVIGQRLRKPSCPEGASCISNASISVGPMLGGVGMWDGYQNRDDRETTTVIVKAKKNLLACN